MTNYKKLGMNIGDTVDEKQRAYGDSSGSTAKLLELLYPSGIPPRAYKDVHLMVRIFDKMKRIATDPGAYGEDPYMDIAGYGLLGFAQAGKSTMDGPEDA